VKPSTIKPSEFAPLPKSNAIKIDHTQRHPLASGAIFSSLGAELKWARGKQSSADFETIARHCDWRAGITAKALQKWRRRRAACEQIAADLNNPPEVRAEAQGHIAYIEKFQLPNCEANLQHAQESAADNRKMAEQARKFEARWDFNPYKASG
jgi:hypothetical protein